MQNHLNQARDPRLVALVAAMNKAIVSNTKITLAVIKKLSK